jgi:hypothetical protein
MVNLGYMEMEKLTSSRRLADAPVVFDSPGTKFTEGKTGIALPATALTLSSFYD